MRIDPHTTQPPKRHAALQPPAVPGHARAARHAAGGAASRAATRALAALLAATLAVALPPWAGTASAQSVVATLPALGDAAGDELGLGAERQLGDRLMRDLRRDPDVIEDPLLLEYLQSIWQPLVAAARARGDVTEELATRFAWEPFLVRDPSVNAFALPGGYIGVHLGLISRTDTAAELAAVLAHELAHVTQRHIARSIGANRRTSMVGVAAILLGILAATRSTNPDVANALIVGGQAVPAQAQLNFSRDMEREADRIGQAVLARAGHDPAAMADMFELLQQASRLNDNGAFGYLRSHPLTPERIGDARARIGIGQPGQPAVPMATRAVQPLLHAALQGRARAGMDARAASLQRLAERSNAPGPRDGAAAPALAEAVAAAAAAQRLKEWPAAEAAYERALLLARAEPAAARAVSLMQAEMWIERGQPARAREALAASGAAGSRPALLLAGRAALAEAAGPGANSGLSTQAQALQTWVTLHPGDASAWSLLSQLLERQGQTLAAVRAQAEAQAAAGDLGGAVDRLRAGQRLARGGRADTIEAAVIDARLRDLEIRRREEQAREADSGER